MRICCCYVKTVITTYNKRIWLNNGSYEKPNLFLKKIVSTFPLKQPAAADERHSVGYFFIKKRFHRRWMISPPGGWTFYSSSMVYRVRATNALTPTNSWNSHFSWHQYMPSQMSDVFAAPLWWHRSDAQLVAMTTASWWQPVILPWFAAKATKQ